MGAASCDVPTIVVSGGPMLNGRYRGQTIGSGTVVWQFSEAVKAGTMSEQRVHGCGELHEPVGRATA
jgi:L-arabonate dehydrase